MSADIQTGAWVEFSVGNQELTISESCAICPQHQEKILLFFKGIGGEGVGVTVLWCPSSAMEPGNLG